MGKSNKNKNKPQQPATSAAEPSSKPQEPAPAKQNASENSGKVEQASVPIPPTPPAPATPPTTEKLDKQEPGPQVATSEKVTENNVVISPEGTPQNVTTQPGEVSPKPESPKQSVPEKVKEEDKPKAGQKAKEATPNSDKPAAQDQKKEQNASNLNKNQGKHNKEQQKSNAEKAGGKGKPKDHKAPQIPDKSQGKPQEAKAETPIVSQSIPNVTAPKFSEVVSEKAQPAATKAPQVLPEQLQEPAVAAVQPKQTPEANQAKSNQQQQHQKTNAQNNTRKRTNSRQKTPENLTKVPTNAQETPAKIQEKIIEKPLAVPAKVDEPKQMPVADTKPESPNQQKQQQQKTIAQNNNRKRTNSRQKTPENLAKVPAKAHQQEPPLKKEEKSTETPKQVPSTPQLSIAQEKPSKLLPKPAETSPEKLQDSTPKVPAGAVVQDSPESPILEVLQVPPSNNQSGKQESSKNKSKLNQQGKGQQNQNKASTKGAQTKTPEVTDKKVQETKPTLPESAVTKVAEVVTKAPEIVGVTPKDSATKSKEIETVKVNQPSASSPIKEVESVKEKQQTVQTSNPAKDTIRKSPETDKKERVETTKNVKKSDNPEKESQNKPSEKPQETTKSDQQKPSAQEKNQKGKKQDQRKPGACENIREAKNSEASKPPATVQEAPDTKQNRSSAQAPEKNHQKKQDKATPTVTDLELKSDKAKPLVTTSTLEKKQAEAALPVSNINSEQKPVKAAVPITDKVAEAPKKPTIREAQHCAVCDKVANSRCGGCNSVNYCSKEHQKQHWKKHRGSCIAWKICTSPELGRYLAATRDIRPGEVIIQEKPLLLTSPKVTAPVCLSCYHELLPSEEADSSAGNTGDEDIKPVLCDKNCGWPLCSSSTCKENRADHEPECKAGKERGGVKVQNFGQEHPMYQAVGILRALALQKTCPEDFNNFMSLQSSNPAATSGDTPTYPDINVTVKLIRDFFQYSKQGVTEDIVKKISGIIDLNGHEIPIPGNYGQINRRLIGVYYTSSFLEHNCRPNCTKTWDVATESRSIVIRSAIPIKKGEHLSISYVDPLWGTNDRQHFLQMTKFFVCKCSRCLDPTELGCHISSVRCQQIQCSRKAEVEEKTFVPVNKRSGMIVPMDPLNGESPWKCLTCNEQYPVKYASSIVDKIASEMEKFQEMRGDIAASEEFLKKFSKVLPPYHFFLLEIKVELAQLYGRTPEEPLPVLAPIKLLRKKVLCEELLQALNVILPGLNRLRALILYELQATVGTLSKIKASVGDISAEMHYRELQKCHSQLSEVVRVLAWEPQLSVEYRRCDGARRELADLAATLADFSVVNEETATPSLKITSSNAHAENIIPVAASRDRIEKLAAQSKLDDDELELF